MTLIILYQTIIELLRGTCSLFRVINQNRSQGQDVTLTKAADYEPCRYIPRGVITVGISPSPFVHVVCNLLHYHCKFPQRLSKFTFWKSYFTQCFSSPLRRQTGGISSSFLKLMFLTGSVTTRAVSLFTL